MTRFSSRRASLCLFAAFCLLGLALAFADAPSVLAAKKQGLVVTPLGGESGGNAAPGGSLSGADGNAGAPGNASGNTYGSASSSTSGSAPGTDGEFMQAFPEQPSYKDGIIMAYLVELMRKQDKPCPSGAKPAVPPSLLFSEPLCRVAENAAKGAELPAAFDDQGVYALHWRMFSAGDQPPQTVATRLRAEHCEALMEPYTHIGAWHGPSGWRIVLGTLTDKPPVNPDLTPGATPDATPDTIPGAGPAAVPVAAPSAAPSPKAAAPAAVPTAALSATPAPVTPAAAASPAKAAPASAELVTMPGAKATPAPAPSELVTTPVTRPAPAASSLAEAPAAVPSVVAAPAPAAPVVIATTPPDAIGQEARALFSLMNDLRVKGGSCPGQPVRTAPPLAFNAALQATAEREAADAAARGSLGTVLGISLDIPGETLNYSGYKVARLAASGRSPAPVIIDVWKVNSTRCATLLSPDYQDAGVAHVGGYWIVLMGQRGRTTAP